MDDLPPQWKVSKDDADYTENVRCVVMPCCGFTYDAFHVTTDDEYVCPLCAPVTEVPQHGPGFWPQGADLTVRYSDLQRRGAPATTERRDALLDWLRQHYRRYGYGLTAREVAEDSHLYDGAFVQAHRQERCASDLRALERFGLVVTTYRIGGHWRPVIQGERSTHYNIREGDEMTEAEQSYCYHPDPEIAAGVAADTLEAEREDLAAGYPPRRWRCPDCGVKHGRGHFMTVGVHRCLGCGYVGTGGEMLGPPEGRN